MPAVSLVSG
uniref:Uncharacterized protein n=1 Tax=Anguilla anguilla TaxID=7936 RepID=A0A0E9QWC2_ANGAN